MAGLRSIFNQATMRYYTLLLIMFMVPLDLSAQRLSWTADNGNGTFTNPLFYDEFSDPDILRVADLSSSILKTW